MDSSKNIAILCHKLSGNGKGLSIARETAGILDNLGINHTLFINQWPNDFLSFSEIWISGGDGTIHHYINKYNPEQWPVALIGGGTGNDLKTFLYGKNNIEDHIRNLLNHYNDDYIDLGNCNGILYANSLGIGFDGDVLKNMMSIRKIGGHLGYLIAVIKTIFTFREKTFVVSFSDKKLKIQPVILAVSNSRLTGGGFIIAPKASLMDGYLDLMYTDPLPWWKRLWVLPKVEKGNHLLLSSVHHEHVQQIQIKPTSEVMFQIDGELMSADKFDIKIHDKKLKLRLVKLPE
ncbi:MAG: hypothetical protein IPN79_18130 [Saprospiraceae bacterium]|nr:hypothetical protein [Saprospiraceae bacterium]